MRTKKVASLANAETQNKLKIPFAGPLALDGAPDFLGQSKTSGHWSLGILAN